MKSSWPFILNLIVVLGVILTIAMFNNRYLLEKKDRIEWQHAADELATAYDDAMFEAEALRRDCQTVEEL